MAFGLTPQNQKKLEERIRAAGEAALAKRKFVTAIDILVGIGWLTPVQVERWRAGQIPYLERVATASLPKLGTALRLFRSWAGRRGLKPSETTYRHRSQRLRFTRFGERNVERAYSTHWISPTLSGEKQARRSAQAEGASSGREGQASSPRPNGDPSTVILTTQDGG
jgi:hypothetical protein